MQSSSSHSEKIKPGELSSPHRVGSDSSSSSSQEAHSPHQKHTGGSLSSVTSKPKCKITQVRSQNRLIKYDPVKAPNTEQLFNLLNQLISRCDTEVWFNSDQEMSSWIQSQGKLEGIGIWDGKWMNFTGKGPIVFGEEHNDIRKEFIRALNINHFIVEGAFERSLTGVSPEFIPEPPASHVNHRKYSGDTTGKALENFWVRSGQSMARFWVNFEKDLQNIDVINPDLNVIDNLGELEELMRTVSKVKAVTDRKTGIEKQINEAIQTAQFYLAAAQKAGLEDIINSMKLPYRAYMYRLPDVIKRVNGNGNGVNYLGMCFANFKQSIEDIGYLQFKASATEEELGADEYTKSSSDPFEVWGGRRELFMLRNLEEALGKTPQPLITTMGATHARHQEARIESLLGPSGGRLIIGSITDLADYGALRMDNLNEVSEGISEELAMMYGWSETYRKEYAKSNEARNKAKIRIFNSKKPSSGY